MNQDDDIDLDEKGPERTCIVTRAKGTPERMIRFVVGPDGAVVPDVRARLPGRGAWVAADRATVADAVRRRSFARAFKREVTAAADLPAQVEALLSSQSLQALALANKAGLAVTGAAKVEGALGEGSVVALLHAQDGSPDGIRKIEAASRRLRAPERPPMPSLQIFSSQQMDLAFGRSNVIHAALLVGGASGAFLDRAARLHRYRNAGMPPGQGDESRPQDA